MKGLIIIVLLIVCSSPIVAQRSKRTSIRALTMAEQVELAGPTVCGVPDEIPPVETFTGVVKQRVFEDDEITLSGFVLADSKDQREYINIDFEYVSGIGRWVPTSLSEALTKGSKVKIQAFRCGRLYYLRNIRVLN